MSRLVQGVVGLTAIAVLCAAPAAQAAPNPVTPISGQMTITGTDGKDEITVLTQLIGADFHVFVSPAATVTATSGTCPPQTDPLTGRPTVNDCVVGGFSPVALVADLRKGDDKLAVSDNRSVFSSTTISAGAGNDDVFASSRTAQVLKGDDGNDVLASQSPALSSSGMQATLDGGAGIDTARWTGVTTSFTGALQELGVNASLATKRATFTALDTSATPVVVRTDTLTAIEALVGTEVGDVLVGSTAADTLTGASGNDNLNGGDGPDTIAGGDGLDELSGGLGADTIDGGNGIDAFKRGDGGDSYNTRDGFLEEVPCVRNDVITDDLVDRVSGDPTLCSISTAAAKHHHDTTISSKPVRVRGRSLVTSVHCPRLKPERCEGELVALLGRRDLGGSAYRVRPGRSESLRLRLSRRDARRAEGRRIVLSASEIDPDGRDRFISRPVRVARG